MKLSILSILILINHSVWAQTNHQQITTEKALPKAGNYTEVPCSFSEEVILESNSLNKLQSKKIKRVELIYTRFKDNKDFDQVQLNEARMKRLNQLLPNLKKDNPEIIWIEQTGATTREEAVNYFHGFRIYTDDPAQIPRGKSTPTSMFTVDNAVGGNFSHPSGTQIHIPAEAFMYEDGTKVIGAYTFNFREYPDADKTVLSEIPIAHDKETGYYFFGTYEIRAYNGKILKLQKEVIVDF
jgi:hypothetical protein